MSITTNYIEPKPHSDLVSVIIPAYNHESYVQECIQSIIDQTYRFIELIILNDGSTDKTHSFITEMLPACRDRFTHIEYIDKPNEGLIKTLNLGLSKIRGTFIYLIASDDRAMPHAIETLHRFLSTHDEYGLVVGDNAIIDHQGQRCYWNANQEIEHDKKIATYFTFGDFLQKNRKDVDFDSSEFGQYPSLLLGNYIPNGYLIRKTIVNQIGGYSEYAPLEDYYLMMQISKISALKYIDEVLFHYRWHDGNTIKNKNHTNQISNLTLKNELPYAKKHGLLLYIPTSKKIKFFKIPLYEKKSSKTQLKIKILNLTLYNEKVNHTRYCRCVLLGIPIYSKQRINKEWRTYQVKK